MRRNLINCFLNTISAVKPDHVCDECCRWSTRITSSFIKCSRALEFRLIDKFTAQRSVSQSFLPVFLEVEISTIIRHSASFIE